MRVTARAFSQSFDIADSLDQVVPVFEAALANSAAALPHFADMGELCVFVDLLHPIHGAANPARHGNYHAPSQTYFVRAQLDYDAWIAPDCEARINLLAQAISDAVKRIARTRISLIERSSLLDAIEQARQAVQSAMPCPAAKVLPIIVFNAGTRFESVNFGGPAYFGPEAGSGTVVPPEEVSEFAAQRAMRLGDLRDGPVKTYRAEGNTLLYREAWLNGVAMTRHWGNVGERGESREDVLASRTAALRAMENFVAEAKADGFRKKPITNHALIKVSLPLRCSGKAAEEVHFAVNQRLGWLGLGHCEGPFVEDDEVSYLACWVVDRTRACEALRTALNESNLGEAVISARPGTHKRRGRRSA